MATLGFDKDVAKSSIDPLYIGSRRVVRAYGATIESTYASYGDSFEVGNFSQIMLFGDVWLGSSSAVDVFILWSHDNQNWFNSSALQAASDGYSTAKTEVIQFATSGRKAVALPVQARYMTIQWVGYGNKANSYLGIDMQAARMIPS